MSLPGCCRLKRCLTFIFLINLFFILITPKLFGQSTKEKHILLLHSYHSGMTWIRNVENAVYDVLDPVENGYILHIEYLDTKRFHSEDYLKLQKKLLETKYKNLNFSLIMLSDNNAYDFLRSYRKELFPGVPVSFCGVNDFDQSQIEGMKDFTGVAEIISPLETVKTALELHPEVKHIYVINDYLKTGRAWKRQIERELKELGNEIEIEYNENLPLEKLKNKVSELGPGSLLLMGVYYADIEGRYLTFEEVGSMITGVADVPVYCLLRFNLRDGAIGGKVIAGYYQGKAMAEIGKKILDGADADKIPVVVSGANHYMFNYPQLARWDIDPLSLPEKSIILKALSGF